MTKAFEAQASKLMEMKKEFNRAVDEAIAALCVIEERSKSQEWLDYADEYEYDVNDLMEIAIDRLDHVEQYYNETYTYLYLDDIAYNDLEDLL